MQPGQVIIPHSADEPTTQPIPPAQPNPGSPDPGRANEPGEEPLPPPAPGTRPETAATAPDTFRPMTAAEPVAQAPTSPNVATPEADSPWQFTQPAASPDAYTSLDEVTWESPEFVEHSKGARWYGAVVAAGVVAAALDYILTKDWFSTGAITFATVALAAYGARKPREQQYALTRQGLQIGNRLYSLQDFKNFSIAEEGETISVMFMPLKRFMPALTIHVAPEIEERVVGFLAAVLPFEEHPGDVVEGLMRRIRF
jgi:hypothetical protein